MGINANQFSRHSSKTATQTWRNALKKAGIPKGFRWHDLRHTWASWHAQDDTPLHVLQELGGWASANMVQRYAHLSTEHLAGYVEDVSDSSWREVLTFSLHLDNEQ